MMSQYHRVYTHLNIKDNKLHWHLLWKNFHNFLLMFFDFLNIFLILNLNYNWLHKICILLNLNYLVLKKEQGKNYKQEMSCFLLLFYNINNLLRVKNILLLHLIYIQYCIICKLKYIEKIKIFRLSYWILYLEMFEFHFS